MSQFLHPSMDDVTLPAILNALGDPLRMQIVQNLRSKEGCMSCSEASPCHTVAKSTLSHHFRILREAGLVRTVKQGVEHRNTLRTEELEKKFPGLLSAVLQYSDAEDA